MKLCSKRILPVLAALTLSIPLISSSATAAEASDFTSSDTNAALFTASADPETPTGTPFQPTNSYVLAFGQGGAYEYAYFSPFVPELTYNGNKVDGYSILFGLQNTYTGDILETAYCTDLPVDAVSADYQRLNLTDSTYAASHADKLRAIVLGSYPHISLDALSSASSVQGLSIYEAITATQLAIWKTAHDDTVQITNFLSFTGGAYSSSGHYTSALQEAAAYNNGSAEYQEGVRARIEALYNYLMSLNSRSATASVISSASFASRSSSPSLTLNDDGTYNVSVSATVDIPSGSNVTLTSYIGEGYWYTQTPLSAGSGSYTLTIPNVPASYANDPVTLSIDGTQTVDEDVFLLDAKGIRGVSQSMIAPMSGTVPVHTEIKAEPNRLLELYKKSNDDGSPLANISFEIYYVGSLESFLDGSLGVGSNPSNSDIQKYARSERLIGTITTDQNGYGSLNFSTEDGVYLVKELPNALVEDSSVFYVTLPDYSRCDENGNPSYTITAYPKNTVKTDKVEIEKDVTDLDNEHDSFDVGEDHTWIIQSSIPNSITSGTTYEISDTLDKRLTLMSVDQVTLANDSGTFGNSEDPAYVPDAEETPTGQESMVLEKDMDYAVHISKTESGEDTFTVSLTSAGIQKIASSTSADRSSYELRVYFTAQINTNASMGENIPNQAHISYTNKLNKTYTSDSDQPEVHTGGIQLLKTDSDTNARLKGAVFTVYREATSEDLASGVKYQEIKTGDITRKLIPVSFYANPSMSGDKVTSLTTNENGAGYIYGLAYGDYYLIETTAPDGYNKLPAPLKFTISASSHTEECQIIVQNTAGVELPSTGGTGTQLFTISGLLLIAFSITLLSKKKYA